MNNNVAAAGFDATMREYARAIEGELESCLRAKDTLYQSVLDAMAYSLLGGGKRIRGVMVLAFYRLFAEDARALPVAAAIEMVHAYSLIHDDLPCMDDDDMRRGKPSCHIAYGEAAALLAGDGLLTLAFETACGADFPPERIRDAVKLLAQSAGAHGMIGGQVMDLANEDKRLTAEELDAINDRKTGALFRASAGMGCILGGAAPEQIAAAGDYAAHVGRAFQIMDDVLDVTANQQALGKPVGSDAENHKNTYAALYGVEECRRRVAGHNAEAKAALARLCADGSKRDIAFLGELADWLGGREY